MPDRDAIIKCVNCGKEAFILCETKEATGYTFTGKPSNIIATIECRCFNCGTDFELRGDDELIKKWKKEHGYDE